MDVIEFDPGLSLEELDAKIKLIKSRSQISIHGNNILIAPSDLNAKSMILAMLRILTENLNVDIELSLPINGPLREQILREIKAISDANSVKVVVKKKEIVLVGVRKAVEDTVDSVKFILSFNAESPSSKATVSPREVLQSNARQRDEFGRFHSDHTPKKPKRRQHRCPFCKKEKTSSSFRNHVVAHCRKAVGRFSSEKQRNIAVDRYYRLKANENVGDSDISGSDLCSSESEMETNDVTHQSVSMPEKSSTIEPTNDDFQLDSFPAISVTELLASFKNYSESCFSGKKKHHKTATKIAKIKSIEKVLDIGNVKWLSEMCTDMDRIALAIENLKVENSAKYKLVEAIIDLLNFVKLEKGFSMENIGKLSTVIERWDRARQYFQHGLVADRVVKKKVDTDELERGNFPTLTEVSQFTVWLNAQWNFDFSISMSKKSMEIFYSYVACNLILTTIIRPSSFCRIETKDFMVIRHLSPISLGSDILAQTFQSPTSFPIDTSDQCYLKLLKKYITRDYMARDNFFNQSGQLSTQHFSPDISDQLIFLLIFATRDYACINN